MAKKTIDIKMGDAPVTLQKEQFAQLIEAYKLQNPVKYAQKKETLEKRLATL